MTEKNLRNPLKKTKVEIRKLKPISRFKRRSPNRIRKEKSTPRRSSGTSWIQIATYEELDEAWAEEDAGQITKLEEDVDNQIKIHVESFPKDPEKDRENLERASQELLALKRAVALAWKGFAKVKGYPIESWGFWSQR